MKFISCLAGCCLFLLLSQALAPGSTNTVHTTWLWHLHQPIYWPDRRNYGTDHYENAWDTIQQQNAGRPDPAPEVLSTIFGEADRVNAYQAEPSTTISGLLGYPNAGAQVNYSGALMENVQSLAVAGQLGYGSGWNNGNATARGWTTSGGKPRMDLVNFTYHHALAPLVSDETLEMELRLHQRQMQICWGTSVPLSRGYFPAETCFSEHMIPILNKVGIAWTVVANNHLARTCPDMPIVTGSGGEMCDLPNPADQLNPAQGAGNYQRTSIARGCSPTQVMPFGFQLHYARYVDPNTGTASEIILAPSDQVFGWDDSYSTWDLGQIAPIAARNDPAKPALVLCAHDGDNAWSGGYSYYNEWVGQMASTAVLDGYEPTTIEQFIADFPPDTSDVVHVEDGGWVFADSDFGSPSFINWNWPPSYTDSSGNNVVDPSLGVTSKGDNWRVIIATENRVETAQQISSLTPNVDQVRDPGSFSGTPNAVELGWHYCCASLDSGFMYYGCNGDECERAIVAQSNACRNVDSVIAANPTADTTPPTVFLPQRSPWNPGGTNYGVQYGYKVTVEQNSDFWIWTYAYDVSGITNVSLMLRVDGTNPPTSDQFKTYAGGPLAGVWQATGMTYRYATNSSGYTPQYQADYYYAYVTGISNAFVDYYVSATDKYGNTFKTPIQHVWVGTGSGDGSGGSGGGPVTVSPAPPVTGNTVTIQYVATGRAIASANPVYLHLGWNNWNPVVSPDAAMAFNSASNWWQYTVTVPTTATILNCCFNNGSGTWDNNGGANWNFTVTANSNPQAPSQPQNLIVTSVLTNQINLSWSAANGAASYFVSRDSSTIVKTASTSYSDTGLAANSSHCYFIVASNSVGVSPASATVCTNTPAVTVSIPPFVLDGAFDYPGYLLASSGMVLYGAVRGTTLYVATWSPGTNGPNDHFIFVSDQLLPSATTAAPWAKAGTIAVAATKPYLAGESQNTYVSWYVNNAATNWPCAKAPTNSGALEGTLDLVGAFGYLPTNIYLCAAAYITTNGGPLVAQCPAGSGPNIDPNEFLVIPIAALRDSLGNGTFDQLDPARGFRILSAGATPAGHALIWGSMPGYSYQVLYAGSLLNSWSNLPGASNLAGPLQLNLGFTDAPPASVTQRFYRVKLLP
ncbi:MAG: carbohydrate-binding protein [Limisphaerales bacterium]